MLHLAPAAIADIRSAAQAGLTITTHEKRLHINGYTGEGYIILNEMGDGAYLINGGLYGGILTILGLLFASMGGFLDGAKEGLKFIPSMRYHRATFLKYVGKTASGFAIAGLMVTAASIVINYKTLSWQDMVAQMTLSFVSVWMSSVFTFGASAAIVSPWLLGILGLFAAAAISMALAVIAAQYLSLKLIRKKVYYA